MLSCYQPQLLGICEVCATYLRAELPFTDSNQEDRGRAEAEAKTRQLGLYLVCHLGQCDREGWRCSYTSV